MNTMIRFWKEYDAKNSLEKVQHWEQTNFFERTQSLIELEESEGFSLKDKQRMFYQLLNSYFDDWREYLDEQNRK